MENHPKTDSSKEYKLLHLEKKSWLQRLAKKLVLKILSKLSPNKSLSYKKKIIAKRVKIITRKEELLSTNKPPNAHEKAAIEPTDKSISPRIINIVIPKAMIPKTITVRIMFWISSKSKKAGLIKTAKQQSIKNRIKRLTLFPVFLKFWTSHWAKSKNKLAKRCALPVRIFYTYNYLITCRMFLLFHERFKNKSMFAAGGSLGAENHMLKT